MNPIVQKIQEKFPEGVLYSKEFRGDWTIGIRRDHLLSVMRFLKEDPELDFNQVSDICSVDYPDREERFEVIYQLNSLNRHHRIRLHVPISEDDCVVPSLCEIWRGANFLEREVYDLMGVRFEGHPDLRRIFLPEDFDGHPLRKDYPTEGKGWRNSFDFLPGGAT